jgi:gamma-glutamyltranspeptidase/glutathione hydrolase
MLAAGGNAVDAILATAITLTLVEPVSNGIGSDAYALIWDGRKLYGLNASGRSPAGWTADYFRGKTAMPHRGWDAVTVPGCVSAWVELHGKFGKLPFRKLFEPAIRYGREGFLVSPTIAGQWQAQVDKLKDQPGFCREDARRARGKNLFSRNTHWPLKRSLPRRERRSIAVNLLKSSKRRRRSKAARCAPPTWRRTGPTG